MSTQTSPFLFALGMAGAELGGGLLSGELCVGKYHQCSIRPQETRKKSEKEMHVIEKGSKLVEKKKESCNC